LEGVTGVVIFDDINPISLLELLRPDIYVNGSDWGENCIERPTVEAYGGKIYVVKRGAVSTASTTEIISSHPEHHEEKPVRAVFVDRDGVIVEDVGYLHEVENVRILPQAITGLQEMQNQGFLLFIVTNQSGVGRGKFPATDMHAVNLFIVEELAKNGVYVKKVYHCPHVEEDHCECRKPKVGLLLKAVEEYGVVLEKSYLIGDKSSDIECGRFANAKTIFIENGLYLYASSILPHFRAKNLLEASQYVK
jgi:D-glycero-D-manno-heptose 1,7-bisphosphate phosphatase